MTEASGAPRQSDVEYFQSLESFEGLPLSDETIADDRGPRPGVMELLAKTYPGLIAAGTIGLAATSLSQHFNTPVMLLALLLGMAFHFLYDDKRCKPGIEFCSREVLRCGVALLGIRISIAQIAGVGLIPIVTVVVGIAATIFFGIWLSRRLNLGMQFGLLSGGAVAICGASAALAISTALPSYRQKERDTALTVVGVTTLSTIAMIIYPVIARMLHLDHIDAGLFLGGTIHDVAQVVGAGYMISPEVGDISTYVKLLRVACLIPVVLCISFYFSAADSHEGKRKVPTIPLFLLGFAALVIINSQIAIPREVSGAISTVSGWCLVVAISALGMKTSLANLVKVGWTPIILLVCETFWIAAIVLLSVLYGR